MSKQQKLTKESKPRPSAAPFRVKADWPFLVCFGLISLFYVVMILAMLVAEATYTTPEQILHFLNTPEIRYSTRLSLITCAISTILALWVAVPIGYLMSRFRFPGKPIIDAVLDIPIVLPPLVIGLCLLILFSSSFSLSFETSLHALEQWTGSNIIPLTIATLLITLACCFYLGTASLIRIKTVRILIPTITCALLFFIASRDYLIPSSPNWLPTISGFQQESFNLRDQYPVRLSRHVYISQYTYNGSVNSLKKTTGQGMQYSAELDNFKIIPQHGTDGNESGTLLMIASFQDGIDERFPDGGELELVAIPQKPIKELTALKKQLNILQSDLEQTERERNFLEGEFNSADHLLQLRKQLENIRKQWKSKSLDETLTRIEKSLDTIEQDAAQLRQTIKLLQSNDSLLTLNNRINQFQQSLITLKPGPARDVIQQEHDDLLQLKSLVIKLSAITQKINSKEESINKLTAEWNRLNNNWRTEPTDWNITMHAKRPKLASKPDLTPAFVLPVTYEIPSIILAQFMVACAFAVRTMRVTFDQIHPRFEQVALTLGCSRGQAFWRVVFPQAWRGLMAAGTLAWARSLGEFGPILIFAGSTRMKTEVLPTSVFLEFSTGNLKGAVAASFIIIAAAMIVLVVARFLGLRKMVM